MTEERGVGINVPPTQEMEMGLPSLNAHQRARFSWKRAALWYRNGLLMPGNTVKNDNPPTARKLLLPLGA
jgi:hypothetical protein